MNASGELERESPLRGLGLPFVCLKTTKAPSFRRWFADLMPRSLAIIERTGNALPHPGDAVPADGDCGDRSFRHRRGGRCFGDPSGHRRVHRGRQPAVDCRSASNPRRDGGQLHRLRAARDGLCRDARDRHRRVLRFHRRRSQAARAVGSEASSDVCRRLRGRPLQHGLGGRVRPCWFPSRGPSSWRFAATRWPGWPPPLPASRAATAPTFSSAPSTRCLPGCRRRRPGSSIPAISSIPPATSTSWRCRPCSSPAPEPS